MGSLFYNFLVFVLSGCSHEDKRRVRRDRADSSGEPPRRRPHPRRTRAQNEALGLSQPSTTFGLARLRDRALGLVEDLGERRARVRAVYQAVDRGDRPGSTPATHPRGVAVPRDPPHLPEVLKGETPTTRLVYLYLEPYGEVEVSVRQLEALLGIAHRNAAAAWGRLVELGILGGLEPAANRVGRYRVMQETAAPQGACS